LKTAAQKIPRQGSEIRKAFPTSIWSGSLFFRCRLKEVYQADQVVSTFSWGRRSETESNPSRDFVGTERFLKRVVMVLSPVPDLPI
jgi:hypothetical protein